MVRVACPTSENCVYRIISNWFTPLHIYYSLEKKKAEETDKPSEPSEGEVDTKDKSDRGVVLAIIAAMDLTGVENIAKANNVVCILLLLCIST